MHLGSLLVSWVDQQLFKKSTSEQLKCPSIVHKNTWKKKTERPQIFKFRCLNIVDKHKYHHSYSQYRQNNYNEIDNKCSFKTVANMCLGDL